MACDGGAQLGSLTVSAVEGHLRAVRWAAQWESRKWAIEVHISRRLEADLLAHGGARFHQR